MTPSDRAIISRRIANCPLPDCWAATPALAEAILLAKPPKRRTAANKRDLKRVARKARRIDGV